MTPCVICAHPARHLIEQDMRDGLSGLKIAQKYNTPERSTQRHAKRHLNSSTPSLFDQVMAGLQGPAGITRARKIPNVTILKNLTQRVATVVDSEKASQLYTKLLRHEISPETFDAALDDCIVAHGMSREAIEATFPPHRTQLTRDDAPTYNRTALIATIVWQEWQWIGVDRPRGNIRHFWYTHLMYTLMRTLGERDVDAIMVHFSNILTSMVVHHEFKYKYLNFT